jgi:small subunit ribosomal protein S4
MARHTGPKNKLSRREGFDLFNKGQKLKKLEIKPGEHGAARNRKTSDYGKQLRSKQRAKRFYGVLERQFRNYVAVASKSKAKSGEALISLLEKRLDNVVFRLGLAPTRPAARQLVSHGHVLVNDKPLSIPSYNVKLGDEVSLDSTAKEIPSIKEMLEADEKPMIPDWLERSDSTGKIIRDPQLTDVKEPISVIDIIEFYSR